MMGATALFGGCTATADVTISQDDVDALITGAKAYLENNLNSGNENIQLPEDTEGSENEKLPENITIDSNVTLPENITVDSNVTLPSEINVGGNIKVEDGLTVTVINP